MIEGLGELTDGAPNFDVFYFDTDHTAADKWEAALSKAGSGNYDSMTSGSLSYWSSSEYSYSLAVRLFVNATDPEDEFGIYWGGNDKDSKSSYNRVRPVLAF